MKSSRKNVVASIAFLCITSQLLVWSIALIPLYVLGRLLPSTQSHVQNLCNHVYRIAVRTDDWILRNISQVTWEQPELPLSRNQVAIVIANHCSWSDILILQNLIVHRGPILKFICKYELAFIPFFGLIILAFGFPLVRRKSDRGTSNQDRRSRDLESIREACNNLDHDRAAIIIFPEGTRFTKEKHERSQSRFKHLLNPRLGGFETTFESLREFKPNILDITLVYPRSSSFWEFVGGVNRKIELRCNITPFKVVDEIGASQWLNEVWEVKDSEISQVHNL